jgi:hypothetical protein
MILEGELEGASMSDVLSLERVKVALFAPILEEQWAECVSAWEPVERGSRERVMDLIQGLRREVLEACEGAAGDAEDLAVTLATGFIELKSRWIMLNAQIQYQTFRCGSAPSETLYFASLVSFLIDAVEALLPDSEVARINEFLADPLCGG